MVRVRTRVGIGVGVGVGVWVEVGGTFDGTVNGRPEHGAFWASRTATLEKMGIGVGVRVRSGVRVGRWGPE